MRKYLISITTVIVIFLTGFVIYKGGAGIKGYVKLEENDKALNKKIEEMSTVKNDKLGKAKEELKREQQEYQDKREEYINKIEAAKAAGAEGNVEIESYDIEFLWALIGGYATDHGIKLELELKNGTLNSEELQTTDFKLCDLNFKLIGSYPDITEFIYKIEGDERFGARLSEFTMEVPTGADTKNSSDKKDSKLKETSKVPAGKLLATFTVKGVPVSTKGLKELPNFNSAEDTKLPIDKAENNQNDKNSEKKDEKKKDDDISGDITKDTNAISNNGSTEHLKKESDKMR